MSRFVILKNGRPLPLRAETPAQARDIIREEVRKAPAATFEIAKLLRRFSANIVRRRVEREEVDLDSGQGSGGRRP